MDRLACLADRVGKGDVGSPRGCPTKAAQQQALHRAWHHALLCCRPPGSPPLPLHEARQRSLPPGRLLRSEPAATSDGASASRSWPKKGLDRPFMAAIELARAGAAVSRTTSSFLWLSTLSTEGKACQGIILRSPRRSGDSSFSGLEAHRIDLVSAPWEGCP